MAPKKTRTVVARQNRSGKKALQKKMKQIRNGHFCNQQTVDQPGQSDNVVGPMCHTSVTTTETFDVTTTMDISKAESDQTIDYSTTQPATFHNVDNCIVSTPRKDYATMELFSIPDTNISAIEALSPLPDHVENKNLVENDTIITELLEGRRIVDIQYIFSQIQKSRHDKFDCSFLDMEFQSEIRKGYSSVFKFQCKVCGTKSSIFSENTNNPKYLGINLAITNGTIAVGIGHTQLSELCASVEIPSLSSTSYLNNISTVSDAINDAVIEEIKKAGEEERRIAIKNGNVDDNGVPMCTVIADGQWSKRSYKTKFNVFSGAAAIIGLETKKVLFIGIRNSYCCICQRAIIQKEKPPSHLCFVNWKKASTAMEADAILEGFTHSISMHGLKYNKLIGDGDSSVTKRLNEVLPYGSQFKIKKIECRNHLLRNYCSKLMLLTKRTDYPIAVRKCITSNILRFRSDITKAIKHHLNKNSSIQQKVIELRKDISNSVYHRLGQHYDCARYFCPGTKIGETNLVPDAERVGMMVHIRNIGYRLSVNADSLIENVDNNLCEQLNSLINKHIGGKRINFTQRNNYTTRVEAAVVAFNSTNFLRAVQKKIIFKSPGKFGKQYINNINRKRKNTITLRRKLFECGNKRTKSTTTRFIGKDINYGLAEPLDNLLTEEELEKQKQLFLEKLEKVDRKELEYSTREQSHSQDWYTERKKRLTASNFGDICKMRSNTSCRKKVFSLLYGPNTASKEMSYGLEMEPRGRTQFEILSGLSVQQCGLFTDKEFPFLAASQDGLVGSDAIVEIKCPFVARNSINAIDAIENKVLQYCNIVNNAIELKREHKYYYQITGQLRIANRSLCYFVVYTPNWTNIQKIKFDEMFWKTKMSNKLNKFYLDCILPEIVDPLYGKRLELTDIREPVYIQEAQKKKKK